MAERAPVRLVSRPGEGGDPHNRPGDPGLTPIDLDAARELAALHRSVACALPPDSRLRGLVLRCAGHWSRLGAIPRNGLEQVDRG
jgi:hypothetical protein